MENMDPTWSAALWQQFGAALEMLDNAVEACPVSLWRERLWSNSPDHPQPSGGEFWFVADSPSGAKPPSPFPAPALDAKDDPREQPYTKDALLAYFAYTKQKCHRTISTLTGERARIPYEFPWEKGQGRPISYQEMRREDPWRQLRG
jgi:hypothetical protein